MSSTTSPHDHRSPAATGRSTAAEPDAGPSDAPPTPAPTTRRVVVSGGGTGIGRAIAGRFAEQGAEVVILGRRAEVLEAAAGSLGDLPGEVSTCAVDLADPETITAHLDVIAGDGPVGVIVNAAGGLVEEDVSTLAGVARAWQDLLAGNLLSAVLLTEALRPHLSPGGRVISIGSIAGSTGAGAYGAAKAAMVAWNATLAGQLAPSGGTANVIAPGYVTETDFFGDRMTDQRHERLVGNTLLGRAGRPVDVAGAAAFLASNDAAWITGQVLHVNGGALLAR